MNRLAINSLAVWLLALSASAQSELFSHTGPNGQTRDRYGDSVAISGDLVLIGASTAEGAQPTSGVVYVREGWTGELRAELRAADGESLDRFGSSLAVEDGIAAVGAPREDELGDDAGAVYLFDLSSGAQLYKLTASDGGAHEQFGLDVALSDGQLVVGTYMDGSTVPSAGKAYVFDVASGQELHVLEPTNGVFGDLFGFSVAIDAGRVAVAAPAFNNPDIGAVYLFDASLGIQRRKIVDPNPSVQDTAFGSDVDISGPRLLIGAPGATNASPWRGSVYVFEVSTGQQLYEWWATEPFSYHWLGERISLDGDRAVVGSRFTFDPPFTSGAAYVFDVESGNQLFRFIPSEAVNNQNFGWSVDLKGDRALVGSGMFFTMENTYAHAFTVSIQQGEVFCAGDGSGAACPCSNPGGSGEGCANSNGAGATIQGQGSSSVAADDLLIFGAGLPAGQPALLFAGSIAVGGGAGVPLGDGLRCAGGEVVRLNTVQTDAQGNADWGPGLAAASHADAGDTTLLQAWYRDPAGGPCATGVNLSNGLSMVWNP